MGKKEEIKINTLELIEAIKTIIKAKKILKDILYCSEEEEVKLYTKENNNVYLGITVRNISIGIENNKIKSWINIASSGQLKNLENIL